MRKRLLIPLLVCFMGLAACDASYTINPGKQIDYVYLSENSVSLDIGNTLIATKRYPL